MYIPLFFFSLKNYSKKKNWSVKDKVFKGAPAPSPFSCMYKNGVYCLSMQDKRTIDLPAHFVLSNNSASECLTESVRLKGEGQNTGKTRGSVK